MTRTQKQFLKLAVIDQVKYDDIELKLGIKRKDFAPWWDELKEERERLSSLRKTWKSKCQEIDFWTFEKWFKETTKACNYCHITEEQIKQLLDNGPITKRNRGTKLEIDRKQPNLPYDKIENLVFSCYWCNNAKTDTFTEEEFLVIGKAIESVWQQRLANLVK